MPLPVSSLAGLAAISAHPARVANEFAALAADVADASLPRGGGRGGRRGGGRLHDGRGLARGKLRFGARPTRDGESLRLSAVPQSRHDIAKHMSRVPFSSMSRIAWSKHTITRHLGQTMKGSRAPTLSPQSPH